MDGVGLSLGELMADLMVDMGSGAGGAAASELSRIFDSLHSLSVNFLLPGGSFARFSNFMEEGGQIRVSFHTNVLDQLGSVDEHDGRESTSERQDLTRDRVKLIPIPWKAPLGLPEDCIRTRGVIVLAWAPGGSWQTRYLRQAQELSLSLSDALEERAGRIVRDLSILAPQTMFGPPPRVRSCDSEATLQTTPELPDMVDWDAAYATFCGCLTASLDARSRGEGGSDGPEEAGPCIERDATGMGLPEADGPKKPSSEPETDGPAKPFTFPETDGPAKPFAEIQPAGVTKSMGVGADGTIIRSWASSSEVRTPDLGGSSCGIARPTGGLLPQHLHSLTFRNAVAETNFGVVFARHRYRTDVFAVFLMLVGRLIISRNKSVNLRQFFWGGAELACLLLVVILMVVRQNVYIHSRDWFVAGVTIGFRLCDLWCMPQEPRSVRSGFSIIVSART